MKRHFSYANVAASAALFLAVAGGTTAIALGGGASKPLKRSGVLTSRITGLAQGSEQCGPVSGIGTATSGCSPVANPPWQLSPAAGYKATDLAVEITAAGDSVGETRTFSLVVEPFNVTALSCTVAVGLTTCRDPDSEVAVPAGSQLLIHQTPGNGGVPDTDAMVSFRLTKP